MVVENYAQFIEAIARARRRCGLTQEEAAKRLGVSRRQYLRYEHGDTVMTLDIAMRLLAMYGAAIKIKED